MNTDKKFRTKLVALMLGVALLGTFAGVAISANLNSQSVASAESLSALTAYASNASDLDSPFKTVYDEVSKSVVGIQLNLQRRSINGRITADSSFVGSGVVLTDDGYVVTNYHVVTAGGTRVYDDISVLYEGKAYSAEYVAGDEGTDIAVLKVKGLDAPAVRLGNSDELSVGDWALVIGNPLGEDYTNTLTVGVVSGLDRTMTNKTTDGKVVSNDMIQTNAAINSGNSGGGLFNIRGELVGITSMKLSNNGYFGSAAIEGIGFAIPINQVLEVADELISHGSVRTPMIGIGGDTFNSPSDEPTKDYLPKSVWVLSVTEGGPAEAAGIQVNDLIVEVNGERIHTFEELSAAINKHKIGDTISVTVYRVENVETIRVNEDIPEGEYITFEIELAAMDADTE